MEKHTTFVPKDDVKSKLSEFVEEFESCYKRIETTLHEELYPLDKDSYHFIGQLLKHAGLEDRVTRALTANLFKAVYQAELNSAGSAQVALSFGLAFTKELIKSDIALQNEHELTKQFDDIIGTFNDALYEHCRVGNPEDVYWSIKRRCHFKEDLTEAVWQAVNLAGLEGKIFIEDGRQSNYIVELKEGYRFKLKPFKFMLGSAGWEQHNTKVLIIDGLVDKVSEIDHLLNKCMETGQAMVIIAGGFSEEVAATLKANQDRGLLDIQPVRVPSDLSHLNITNDIAVVCDTHPVSSLKGDLISCVKYDDIPVVDKVSLTENECVIENPKSRTAVSEHLKHILAKRQDNYLYEDVQRLLDGRMKSLVATAATIHLPEMTQAENNAIRAMIDVALREVKTISTYGTIDLRKLQFEFNPQTYKSGGKMRWPFQAGLMNVLELYSDDETKMPRLSLLMGCMLAGKAVLKMLSSSGMVAIT